MDKTRLPGKTTMYKKKTQFKETHKNLYSQLLITRTVPINITHIGNTIKETLEKAIASQIEGKCIVEGYIKPRSVEVITFSSGLVMSSNVIFEVVIQCEVCSPVEGMHIKCIVKHINKAGIRAEINETPSPVVIFIARDHNYASPLFAEVKENDEIKIRVIGQRFELNDKYISIIAEIVEMDAQSEKSPLPTGMPVPLFESNIQDISPEETIIKPTVAAPSIASQAISAQATAQPTASGIAPPTIAAPTIAQPTVAAQTIAAPTIAQPTASGIAAPTIAKKATIRIKKPKITVQN
jgi:DNA-directed RNA polymerase subunit E'/Rpb7